MAINHSGGPCGARFDYVYGVVERTISGYDNASLWSVDLLLCESILLKSHWVMVAMDQYTRRIIGPTGRGLKISGGNRCRLYEFIYRF